MQDWRMRSSMCICAVASAHFSQAQKFLRISAYTEWPAQERMRCSLRSQFAWAGVHV